MLRSSMSITPTAGARHGQCCCGTWFVGRSKLLVLTIVLQLGIATLAAPATIATIEEQTAFTDFSQAFTKQYKDDDDLVHHEDDFAKNVRFVESFNKDTNHSCTLKVTGLADLNVSEFESTHTGLLPEPTIQPNRKLKADWHVPQRELSSLPTAVDWVKAGKVTSVKDQSTCGSCYTFAGIAALEGAWAIQTEELIDLSNQQVLDCTYKEANVAYPNQGCGGGYMSTTFQYMVDNAICSWDSYPYNPPQGVVGTCRESSCTVIVPKGDTIRYTWVNRNSVSSLMEALVQQPVQVSVAAGSQAFMLYASGVITAKDCGTSVDHAVLAVGYGTDTSSGLEYWTIKNSWGTSWGESGYVRVQRDAQLSDSGGCGILSAPNYPTVASSAKPSGGTGTGQTTAATTTTTTKDGDDDDDANHAIGVIIGSIVAAVIGAILLGIAALAILLCCCTAAGAAAFSRERGSRGGSRGGPQGYDQYAYGPQQPMYGADPYSQPYYEGAVQPYSQYGQQPYRQQPYGQSPYGQQPYSNRGLYDPVVVLDDSDSDVC